MFERIHAHIDLNALKDNLDQIKKLAKNSKVLAIVKCNAYGHGAQQIAKSLDHEVAVFGVMFLEEALNLASIGIQTPIVILTGFLNAEELAVIDNYGFETTVHNYDQLELLERSKLSRKLTIWLKIDTGMHRLGFQPNQVPEVYRRLRTLGILKKPLRFITHFAEASDPSSDKTFWQFSKFKEATKNLDGEWCLANSAAILNWPHTNCSIVRPGILLYGASPLSTIPGLDLGLKPVMTLVTKIISIHNLPAGEKIGYGGTFTTPYPMTTGTLAIGYGDGYLRNSINSPALVNGKKAKLLGRIAMDMAAIDLTDIPNIHIGSEVILWGQGLPIEEVAEAANTIPYELFTRLSSSRVSYIYH